MQTIKAYLIEGSNTPPLQPRRSSAEQYQWEGADKTTAQCTEHRPEIHPEVPDSGQCKTCFNIAVLLGTGNITSFQDMQNTETEPK